LKLEIFLIVAVIHLFYGSAFICRHSQLRTRGVC